MSDERGSRAFRAVGAYALFGVLWILLSDLAASALIADPTALARIQTVKGWLFVAVSAALVYLLVSRAQREHTARLRESRRSAEDLQRAHQSLDQALHSIKDGVAVVRDRTIQQVNPAFCELFGYEPEELIGRDTRLLHVDESQYQEFARMGDPVLRGVGTFRSTFTMRRKSGEVFPSEHTMTLLDPSEGIEGGVVSVVRDLSELQEMRRRKRLQRRELQRSTEEERRRIARDLHDGVGQLLASVRMAISRAGKGLAEEHEARTSLKEADELVGESLDSLRRAIVALRPPVLDTLGLLPALEWLCERFGDESGVDCRFISELDALDLSDDGMIHLYRIVQEALSNVARHAEASAVQVRLYADGSMVALEVRDDGQGLRDGADPGRGRYGLRNMRERADLMDGVLHAGPAHEGGTVVKLTFPVVGAPGDGE